LITAILEGAFFKKPSFSWTSKKKRDNEFGMAATLASLGARVAVIHEALSRRYTSTRTRSNRLLWGSSKINLADRGPLRKIKDPAADVIELDVLVDDVACIASIARDQPARLR